MIKPADLTDEMIHEQLAIERSDGNRINVDICRTAMGRTRCAGQVVNFHLDEIAQARCT